MTNYYRRQIKALVIVLIIIAAITYGLYLVISNQSILKFLAGKSGTLGVPIIFLTILLAIFFFIREFQDTLEDLINFIMGQRGERRVEKILAALPSTFHVIPSVMLQRGGNVDFVLVGPTGIYTIEVKTSRNMAIRYLDRRYAKQVRTQAFELNNMLKTTLERSDWIDALLVYATNDLKVQINPRKTKQNVTVLHSSELVAHILTQPQKLSGQDVEKITTVINTYLVK